MNPNRKLDCHLTHTPATRRRVEALAKALNEKFPGARFTQVSLVQAAIERGLTQLEKEAKS